MMNKLPPTPDCLPATVRHVSKDHVTIHAGPGYTVTIFSVGDTEVEAVVAADDGQETIRLKLALPGDGRTMEIKRHPPTGIIDIIYKDKPNG